jgi:CheY-like chemotaxis protein
MDIRMPGIDGMEATRQVRAYEDAHDLEHVPIVALTADVELDRVAAYQEAGMTDLLPKPVTRAQLANIIETWAPTASFHK